MSGRARKSLLYWLALLPLVVVILFPYAVMISTAIKPRAEIMSFPPSWFGSRIELGNFVEMWHVVGFGQALLNSLYVSLGATVLCLVIAIPAGYAMSRFRFPGQSGYRLFLLISQMLSPIVLVIGIFRLMALLGLVDHLNSLVVTYAAFNLAFAIWMLQSYFATIPREIEEAAWIDGASLWQGFVRIVLPLSGPGLAATAILCFLYAWNDFFFALILTRTEAMTAPVAVVNFMNYEGWEWGKIAAGGTLVMLPVLVFSIAVRKFLVHGITAGAVKG